MNFLEPFEILKHLDKLNIVKETPSDYHCTCPVCGDGGFKIEKETGLFNAFKCGCEIPKIREAIKPLAQAFEEVLPPRPANPPGEKYYKYVTWSCQPKVVVKRIDREDGKKDFRQAHWDGETYQSGFPEDQRKDLAIYRWPEVKQAMDDGEAYIFWVEGEKSADALWELGLPATTSIGGSGGYDKYGTYKGAIKGSKVVVCPDMAPDGIKYAQRVQQDYPDCLWLHSFPNAPQWGNIAKGKGHDIANWIAAGATVEDILQAIEDKPRVYEPEVRSEAALSLQEEVIKYCKITHPYEKIIESQRIKKKYGISDSVLRDLMILENQDDSDILHHVSDIVAYTANEIELQSVSGKPQGIYTGFSDLDEFVQGLEPGAFTILAGRPSQGKTALCMAIAANVAASNIVHIFSLEQSKEQLINRLVSSMTGITFGKIKSGQLSSHEWECVWDARAKISSLNMRINDQGGITIETMTSLLNKAPDKPALIIVDYLQLMDGPGDTETTKLSNISRALKALPRQQNSHLIALSQLSRAVEARQDKRPIMSDLRGSGALEQDADLITFIYRDEYYNPNTPDRGIAEIITAKNRNGPIGTAKLLFEPEYTRFSNLEKRGFGY